MIPMAAIREEFGVAKRLTPSTFYSCLELGKGVTHYFFRSVRGTLPDLVTTCSDANDAEFAVWILEAVASRINTNSNAPLKIGFSESNSFAFDAILALPSPYHGHLKGILNDKHSTLVLCVPIHSCEFTGTETANEYRHWQTRVAVERWTRQPYPFVAMECENPRSGHSCPMERTSIEACMANLSALNGVKDGFARIANFNGDIILIKPTANERYNISTNTAKLKCSPEELVDIVSAFVRTGAITAAS